MGIGVTVGAFLKRDPGISRLVVGSGSVAALARNLRMRSREGIACLGMIELLRTNDFPVIEIVALQTIGPQPSFVSILMTGNAARRKP